MPEILDRIRAEMSARLAELRPLVDEHTRLDAALQTLGDADTGAGAPPPGCLFREHAPVDRWIIEHEIVLDQS